MSGLTRDQIVEYASVYTAAEEVGDFPMDGDLFCILVREIPASGVVPEQEPWAFHEYGICAGYRVDDETKPEGKWLCFSFISLATFPPHASMLKLQPPHIVKGLFQDPTRTREHRVVKVPLDRESLQNMLATALRAATTAEKPQPSGSENAFADQLPDNVIRFPGRADKTKR